MTTMTHNLETLQAQHEQANATLTALTQEEAGLPGAIRAAAETGDADTYVQLKARLAEMRDRLKVARLAYATSGLTWAKANYAALTARDEEALRDKPKIHQTDNGGLWSVARPTDTSVALAQFERFREAVTQSQQDLNRL